MGVPEMLLSSGGYRDLPEPVIVTSGEFLTPFFVNAERLCGDPDIDGTLAAHGHSDLDMIEHACALAGRNPGFADVVDQIASVVKGLLVSSSRPVISGGQRRDWLFSGPVARRLGLDHVSLYKQAPGQGAELDRMVVRAPDGGEPRGLGDLEGCTAVHVVDMVTAASSCHAKDPISGREVGWIPMLRSRGARIRDLVAVVSRRQGGEEALAAQGVTVRSLAVVDEAFLARHSRAPEQAVAFYRDPEGWTRSYLAEHGAEVLLSYLCEDAKKLPRLVKFLGSYRAFLESGGLWSALDREAGVRLGRSLQDLVEGRHSSIRTCTCGTGTRRGRRRSDTAWRWRGGLGWTPFSRCPTRIRRSLPVGRSIGAYRAPTPCSGRSRAWSTGCTPVSPRIRTRCARWPPPTASSTRAWWGSSFLPATPPGAWA